jgi:hypothetical protein
LIRSKLTDLFVDRLDLDEAPPLLVGLADRLFARADGLALALRTGRRIQDQQTRFALFRLLAERFGTVRVGDAALEVLDWPALSAALSTADNAGSERWATSILRRVAGARPERVPDLLTYVRLTPERLDLALTLVDRRIASPEALGRLLYGARIRELDEPSTIRLLNALSGRSTVEAALGMLHQWVEHQGQPSSEVRLMAAQLALIALSQEPGTMATFHVAELVKAGVIPDDVLAPLLDLRVMNGLGPERGLDTAILDRMLEDPGAARAALFAIVRRLGSRGAISGGELSVLSRLAAVATADDVWAELRTWSDLDLRWALHHMSWEGSVPDPLVREFLISDRLPMLEDEACVCFSNTLGVVIGPYHIAVMGEVERAKGWQLALTGTPGKVWADKLVAQELASVAWHRQRDEEDDVLRG